MTRGWLKARGQSDGNRAAISALGHHQSFAPQKRKEMKATRLGLITLGVLAASCLGALGREANGPLSTPAAQRRLMAHVSTWSTDPGVNAANVAHHYANRTVYYGKLMSQREVLRDKLGYIAVWPRRRYSIIPGTVSVRCDHQKTVCRVSG